MPLEPHLGSQKHPGQPRIGQQVIRLSRHAETASSFCQCRKGNDLIGGEAVQRGAAVQVLQKLLGDMLSNGFGRSPEGSSLIRTKTDPSTKIGKQRQGSAWLKGLRVVSSVDVSAVPLTP